MIDLSRALVSPVLRLLELAVGDFGLRTSDGGERCAAPWCAASAIKVFRPGCSDARADAEMKEFNAGPAKRRLAPAGPSIPGRGGDRPGHAGSTACCHPLNAALSAELRSPAAMSGTLRAIIGPHARPMADRPAHLMRCDGWPRRPCLVWATRDLHDRWSASPVLISTVRRDAHRCALLQVTVIEGRDRTTFRARASGRTLLAGGRSS